MSSILSYISLPFTTVFNWILVALAPLLHLGKHLVLGFLLPFRLLAKLEVGARFKLVNNVLVFVLTAHQTLYIYLGVAAVIGLVTGFILHISSTILVSLFNLTPTTEETGRSKSSGHAAQEKRKLEQAWQTSTSKGDRGNLRAEPEKNYAEWLELDIGRRRKDHDVLGQTILEEEDDGSEGF